MTDSGAAEDLQRLIPLQEVDTRLDAVRRELGTIESGEAVSGPATRCEGLRAALEARERDRREEETRRRAAEGGRRAKEEEARRLGDRLQSGRLRSAREYESVERELAALREGIGDLETRELLAMERIEALEGNIRELREALAAAERELQQATAAADERAQSLRAEARDLAERREALAGDVRAEVLAEYEDARRSGRGQGIGILEGLRCRACGMELPPVWRQRVRRGRLERCENCGRLLVPAPGVGTGAS